MLQVMIAGSSKRLMVSFRRWRSDFWSHSDTKSDQRRAARSYRRHLHVDDALVRSRALVDAAEQAIVRLNRPLGVLLLVLAEDASPSPCRPSERLAAHRARRDPHTRVVADPLDL